MELEVRVANYDGDLEDLGRAYEAETGVPYELKSFNDVDSVSFLVVRDDSAYPLSAVRWAIEPAYNLIITVLGEDTKIQGELAEEFAQITGLETEPAPTYLRDYVEKQISQQVAILDI